MFQSMKFLFTDRECSVTVKVLFIWLLRSSSVVNNNRKLNHAIFEPLNHWIQHLDLNHCFFLQRPAPSDDPPVSTGATASAPGTSSSSAGSVPFRPPFKQICQRHTSLSSMLPPSCIPPARGANARNAVHSYPAMLPPASLPSPPQHRPGTLLSAIPVLAGGPSSSVAAIADGESTSSAGGDDAAMSQQANKQRRYHSTRAALEQSGLLELTTRLSAVIRNMRQYEQEVRELRQDSHTFLISVLNQPENARFKEYLLHQILNNFKAKLRKPQDDPWWTFVVIIEDTKAKCYFLCKCVWGQGEMGDDCALVFWKATSMYLLHQGNTLHVLIYHRWKIPLLIFNHCCKIEYREKEVLS